MTNTKNDVFKFDTCKQTYDEKKDFVEKCLFPFVQTVDDNVVKIEYEYFPKIEHERVDIYTNSDSMPGFHDLRCVKVTGKSTRAIAVSVLEAIAR